MAARAVASRDQAIAVGQTTVDDDHGVCVVPGSERCRAYAVENVCLDARVEQCLAQKHRQALVSSTNAIRFMSMSSQTEDELNSVF